MTPTAPTMLLTAEEFARLPEPEDGSRQELVRGVIETMPPPGFSHGETQVAFVLTLGGFLKKHPLGRLVTETGVKTEVRPDTVRGPDLSFFSYERLPADQQPAVYADVAPDLVVEIRSPSNTRRRLRGKIKEYLFNGVKLVWVADPEDRTVTVYRQPEEGRELGEDATLNGEDVLPGFTCRVGELFA